MLFEFRLCCKDSAKPCNLCQQGFILKWEPLGNPPSTKIQCEILATINKKQPYSSLSSSFSPYWYLSPSLLSLPFFLSPLSLFTLSSPIPPSLFYISLRLQCVFEEDLADVFDELTANLQVCAKNQGEKERKLNWREREKESGERKSRK